MHSLQRRPAQSARAQTALTLVSELQAALVAGLEAASRELGDAISLTAVEWFRDQGLHGGGLRYQTGDTAVFNRASVNLSQVQYDDEPDRSLASATALSAIMHPQHPLAPSLHLHISWTEMRTGHGYWRIMADLNPAQAQPDLAEAFSAALKAAAPAHYDRAITQGDKYFYIPSLQRHRGVCHFYLEAFASEDDAADRELARTVAQAVITLYPQLLETQSRLPLSPADSEMQLAYHTLYFYQVLTLDRGTTSGLLIHAQNDQGILGSLPAQIDKALLASWQAALPEPQNQLLAALLEALPNQHPCVIDEALKPRLADVVRAHYKQYPEALALQASGDVTPPTVANHARTTP